MGISIHQKYSSRRVAPDMPFFEIKEEARE
jgi:hypothetical protein